jgi:hypothetical protein
VADKSLAGAFGAVALAAALLAAAIQVEAARERAYPQLAPEDDVLYITSPTMVRRLSGPYAAVVADVYWVRAIQYYGGAKRRLARERLGPQPPPLLAAVDVPEYRQLYPLLDITTTLDPRFDMAYRFGAVFLAEPFPGGAGRPDLAEALLEKGLRERPDKWEYMEDIGFVHYWYGHDYGQAAAWFQKAAEVPGAPAWLKPLAATTLAQGGDRRSSRTMWQAMLRSTDLDWLRAAAGHRLLQLQALDELDVLQATVDAYTRRTGEPVTDWRTLLRAGVLPGIPVDPAGTRYQVTPDGRVHLSDASGLLPLPVEPEQQVPS